MSSFQIRDKESSRDVKDALENLRKSINEAKRKAREKYVGIHRRNLKEHLEEAKKLLERRDVRDASEKIYAAWRDYINLLFVENIDLFIEEMEKLIKKLELGEIKDKEVEEAKNRIEWYSKAIERLPSGKIRMYARELAKKLGDEKIDYYTSRAFELHDFFYYGPEIIENMSEDIAREYIMDIVKYLESRTKQETK